MDINSVDQEFESPSSNNEDQNSMNVNQQLQLMNPTPPAPPPPAAAASGSAVAAPSSSSRYENQKRRDWNTFGQYLRNHRPPLSLARCSGAHVLEFLRYLDQFGKTKVHTHLCPFFGHPNPPAPCPCPLRQAWGSLDALIGRLRAAFEEHGGKPEANPFGARAVRLYLREVRDSQSKARGVSYEKKKKRKRPPALPPPTTTTTTATAIAQANETTSFGGTAAADDDDDDGASISASSTDHHHHRHHHHHHDHII